MAGQVTRHLEPYTSEIIVDGSKTVASAGTRVQLSTTSVPTYEVSIQAKTTNTGLIYVGGPLVSSANGTALEAGQAYFRTIQNLTQIWIDASVNGEGITYSYWSIS